MNRVSTYMFPPVYYRKTVIGASQIKNASSDCLGKRVGIISGEMIPDTGQGHIEK